MDRMKTPGNFMASGLRNLRANWPALLPPLVAAGALGLTASTWPVLVIVVAVILTVVAPRESARIAPYALFVYGAYGLYLMHSLLVYEANSVTYGFLHAWWRPGNVGVNWVPVSSRVTPWVLTEAVACLVAGVWLLARPGSPGGGPVRPGPEPPRLVIGGLVLLEELFGQDLSFRTAGQPGFTPMLLVAILIFAAGVAA